MPKFVFNIVSSSPSIHPSSHEQLHSHRGGANKVVRQKYHGFRRRIRKANTLQPLERTLKLPQSHRILHIHQLVWCEGESLLSGRLLGASLEPGGGDSAGRGGGDSAIGIFQGAPEIETLQSQGLDLGFGVDGRQAAGLVSEVGDIGP